MRSPQGRLTTQAEVDALDGRRVERPTDRAGLLDHFDRSNRRLETALASLDPATELWMWADEHTAGYIARRQAHEALIHRLDAELTVGSRTPLDCRLAADGVDEALRVMRGYEPEPGLTHEAIAGSVTIATVDAMHAWTVTPVRITGRYEGEEIDLLRFLVADGPDDDSAAEICGTAADLDCWLWNRPPADEITREGDAAALAAVERVHRRVDRLTGARRRALSPRQRPAELLRSFTARSRGPADVRHERVHHPGEGDDDRHEGEAGSARGPGRAG